MSSVLGLALRSSFKPQTFSNRTLINNLLSNKYIESLLCNTQLQKSFQKQFSSGKSECKKPEASEIINCRRLVCQSNKTSDAIESKKPTIEGQSISGLGDGPLKCLYDDPECCLEKCPDANVRLDCLFYKMSDKKTKKYQQTWADCPPIRKQPKITCHNPFLEREIPLPIRLPKSMVPQTACSMDGKDSKLMQCPSQDKKAACIKIRMPGCRVVRNPPKCKSERPEKHCKKVNCPFPAYSECNKPKVKQLRSTECHCLEIKTMCDIYAIAKKKGMTVTK